MKKLRVNRDIYSNTAIEQTINAYTSYAAISVSYRQRYAIITFRKCKYDEVQTVKEFENYMIGAENS